MKGLPLAYNKDLQESQEPVFAATDAITGSLEVATGFMRSVGFDLDRMMLPLLPGISTPRRRRATW